MNKKRLLSGVTWLATISTLILWFPMIALGILKLKDFITSSNFYQALLTSTTNEMKGYGPLVGTQTIYAIITSVEERVMMFGTLALTIILWGVKIRDHKKDKK